tara:strand:+ start:37 stop:1491 length:1455 start_codon:yes stop_codon:yes gene_type:complete
MQITQNLKLKQSQSLVMTPQLQQAIKLLQLTNLELSDLVNKELEENPFLEDSKFEENKEVIDHENETDSLDEEFVSKDSMDSEIKSEAYDNCWDKELNCNNKSQNYETIDPGSIAEQTVSEEITLKSVLTDQANLEFDKDEEKFVSRVLIDYIDSSGWMTKNLKEISEIIGCEENKVQTILDRMKDFEPSGVFAQNLQECLTIQLKAKELFNEKIKILLENFDLLASGEIKTICKQGKLSREEIVENLAVIRQMNPKPGNIYSTTENNIFHPDVIVKSKNNTWEVELNQSTLPKVVVNENYVNELNNLNCSQGDKKFITESIGSAKWLVKAIEQRNITTLKISSEIVQQQKEFFEKGLSYLKPMILKDVAKKIGMHESTVSRVTSAKLMLTPRGIFDMKHFFSASINSTEKGESYSAASVRETLKNLISSEPLNQPFSDEVIVSKLQKEGINLARRTVAKYRELMCIPSSAERRKIMKIQNISI